MNSNQIENMFVGRNYIHGQFTKRSPESDIFHKINPADGKSLGEFPQTHQREIDLAYTSARKAFKSWRKVSRIARAEYFYKIAKIIEIRLEEIATVISLETGKSFNESIAEVNSSI